MSGLIVLACIGAGLYFGATAVRRFHLERPKAGRIYLDALALWGSAVVYGFVALLIAFWVHSGKEIYGFSLMLNVFLIGTLGLWGLSVGIRVAATSHAWLAANAMRLGMMFVVIFMLVLYEAMKSWFHVRTTQ